MSGPVLLGGYAAKRCARRIHNEWDSTIEVELVPVPAALQMRFDAGRVFEADVRTALIDALGERCFVVGDDVRRNEGIRLTTEALARGVELVVGGWLPDDVAGGRKGRPDVLLRMGSNGSAPAYVAGDIKAHLTTKPIVRGSWTYSTLQDPSQLKSLSARTARIADRYDDYIQVAHYARMLQSLGHAPDGRPSMGFIIGTDPSPEPDEGAYALTWLDLESGLFSTFSRSAGSRKRSALERYDHEHGFRLQVAEVAAQRMGAPDDPDPLVLPFVIDECEACPWRDFCRELLGPDAASAVLEAGHLDVREWQALMGLGVNTAADLASLDLDDEDWWRDYLPEVSHQQQARQRLETAVIRARMSRDGVRLQRKSIGPIRLRRADVEIDFDIEWDTSNRVFLWGALVTNAEDPAGTYADFTEIDPLDEESERALAQRFLDWLRRQIDSARAAGRSVAIYHYSSPEPRYLTSVLGADEAADVLPLFVDLWPIVRANYIGVAGLSIKEVAPEFGFHWRDEDPGGLQAQMWVDEARASDPARREELRRRVVEYNEDDVRATLAVRRGMSDS
jgi:predicted RecB family nuclease